MQGKANPNYIHVEQYKKTNEHGERMVNIQKKRCPICGTEANYSVDGDTCRKFFACPVCGQYDLGAYGDSEINYNHLLSYLVHNRFKSDNIECRYHTTLDKDVCDQYKEKFEHGSGHRWPVHMEAGIIENWYPKTFLNE